jgi:hypothetical protein
MDICPDSLFVGTSGGISMLMSSSYLVCFIPLVRLAEGYYGLRGKPTGGAVHFLSLRKQLIDYLSIRQRKALTPAFSNAAIRKLASVFYDSAYKVRICDVGNVASVILKLYRLKAHGILL